MNENAMLNALNDQSYVIKMFQVDIFASRKLCFPHAHMIELDFWRRKISLTVILSLMALCKPPMNIIAPNWVC